MSELIHEFIGRSNLETPDAPALYFKDQAFTYADLHHLIQATAAGLRAIGLGAGERVAIYLPKLPQTVFCLLGTSAADGVFVPVNPLLKPAQVQYILKDCNVRVLVTSASRMEQLGGILSDCHDLRNIILIDEDISALREQPSLDVINWQVFLDMGSTGAVKSRLIDADMAAILYTSGSTGNPKGVVLSHRNMVIGAKSVASYLENEASDRLLAILPFSFDYGLSQMTTAFSVGASVVLMDYLLPRDVVKAVARHKITGLAAVPPLWNQLAELDWPAEAIASLRYITNSGGAMPQATTEKLQNSLPQTSIFLMYGLTEAFRSTYLPPEQVRVRPDSMGKAIPNAEIMVVREDGSECAPDEPGELVHRGSLVAMGYWNDTEKTAERFRPSPRQIPELSLPEIAVWSGDQVRRDENGYLYFISRKDEMIKTSGYRVSPTEVEEVVYSFRPVREVAALGLPHPGLGQAIFLVVVMQGDTDKETIIKYCQRELPNYMVPQGIAFVETLPRNQNGKIDRKILAAEYKGEFEK